MNDSEMMDINPHPSANSFSITVPNPKPSGNYIRLFRIGNSYLINLGPHFFIQLIIFIFCAIFGFFITYYSRTKIPNWVFFIYLCLYICMILINLWMLFSDPGIIKKNSGRLVDEEKGIDFLKCKFCGIINETTYHCEDCDVCIDGYDHHCGVIGKCIGGKNLVAFYAFVAIMPIFLWGSIFVGIMILQIDEMKKGHKL